MDKFLSKNKYTIISMSLYGCLILLFGDLNKYNLIYLFFVLLTIPTLYNFRLYRYRDKDPIWLSIVAGLIFGFYLTPFGLTSGIGREAEITKIISYWVLLFSLNILFATNRLNYRKKFDRFDRSAITKEERDEKIDKLLNPVKRNFFQ